MKKKKEPLKYVERDVSWMYFNRRILQEAFQPTYSTGSAKRTDPLAGATVVFRHLLQQS